MMEKFEGMIYDRNLAELEGAINTGEFDVNSIVSMDRSALALAAVCNYTEVMECLIGYGADVNLNNEGDLGYTPLEEAAREGNIEAIKILIDSGVEIDKGNTINSNALIGACICAKQEALELLIENGANVNHTDDHGQTALHYLCRYAKQWGSGTITQTVNGVTEELENPRFQQHSNIFNILLTNDADVTLETNYGYTPLHLAAENDTPTFMQPMINKGADVNAQNAKGFSPLHAAADRGYKEPSKILIDGGADVNIVDLDGFTPLLGATSSNKLELVKLFVDAGAKKDIKAKISYGNVSEGDDPLSLAKKLENEELINALE